MEIPTNDLIHVFLRLQPLVSGPPKAGGITECKMIAAMAETWDVALAPRCPLGPIALAASLQVDANAHNAFIQEQSQGIASTTSLRLRQLIRVPFSNRSKVQVGTMRVCSQG